MTLHRSLFLCLLGLGLGLAAAPAFAQKSDAEELIREGDAAFNQGFESDKNDVVQNEIAIDRFEFAVAADPQSLTARLRLAYVYLEDWTTGFEHKRERSAFLRKTYQDALASDPGNTALLWDLAVVEFQTSQFDDSRKWMRKLLVADPSSLKGHRGLAIIAVVQSELPLRTARVAAGFEYNQPDPLPDAAVRAQLRKKYLAGIDEGIAAARAALVLKADDIDSLEALQLLLTQKSTLSDAAQASLISDEIATLKQSIEAARAAGGPESSSRAEERKLRPGQPPPPVEESAMLLPPPPPPPPPPSAKPVEEPPYKDMDPDEILIETRDIPAAVHPHRALVLRLWMDKPNKHERGPLTAQNPYACYEKSLGSYYEGKVQLSLADTQTKRFINTIDLEFPGQVGTGEYDFKLPYRIAPGPYHVAEKLVAGEGKPEFLHLEDYNGDGQALEAAFFQAQDCVETLATLVGYSPKQDKVIQYRFILEKDPASGGGYVNTYWVGNLLSEKPDQPGHWKYAIDHRAMGGGMEQFEIRYDPAGEIFRGTVAGK